MYKVDISNKELIPLTPTTFESRNLKERFDIQEWVDKNPKVLGEDLLIIGKEVPLPSNIRIDLLAVDKAANLVIIELKRDDSGRNVDWQAIKYASYSSSFSNDELFRIYAEYLGSDEDEAETQIEEFVEIDSLEDLNKNQRLILVSNTFHSDVASSVLWLRDFGIDISCIKFSPFIDGNKNLFINPTQIIPLPEAKDYIIKKERKVKEVRRSKESSFSMEESNYGLPKLKEELTSSLRRKSDLTPRVITFLTIISSENRTFDREELKEKLFESGIGRDTGQAGRYLSGISQFLTKKSTPHFRQIIGFSGGTGNGAKKDNYFVKEGYRSLLSAVLEVIDNQKNNDTP